MDNFDWANFAATTRDHEQHFLVERAEGLVPAQGQERNALDLGCGAGRGTKFLLARGWRVTAVDAEAAAIAIVSDIKSDKLRVVQSRFEEFEFGKEVYDLVSAQFSLPFTPRAELAGVVARMKESIKPGGYFAGQFFGTHDEWNKPGSEVNFLTRKQIDELLTGMSLVEVIEDDKEGGTATGANKHWHVFHVIARKNSSE